MLYVSIILSFSADILQNSTSILQTAQPKRLQQSYDKARSYGPISPMLVIPATGAQTNVKV